MDAISTSDTMLSVGETYALIIYYDHFLNTAVSTELIVEIPFRCANAQTKYSQHVTWVRGLEAKSISDPK